MVQYVLLFAATMDASPLLAFAKAVASRAGTALVSGSDTLQEVGHGLHCRFAFLFVEANLKKNRPYPFVLELLCVLK